MMKMLKSNNIENIDLAIVGLGYESRSISRCKNLDHKRTEIIVIGYDEHNSVFSYQENLNYYESINANIIEGADSVVLNNVYRIIDNKYSEKNINCILDITVMSRARLAELMIYLINNLGKDSKIKISYSMANYTPPQDTISPIRKVGPISDSLSGMLGDINLPSSIVIGLGYEIGKAIGINDNLDTEEQFIFIPKGIDDKFELSVRKNNERLISHVKDNHIFTYDISNPYKTYLELRETMVAIMDISRPVLVPLGPKIFSALCVLFSLEMDSIIPVWRVSSEHSEEPVDRTFNGKFIEFTLAI